MEARLARSLLRHGVVVIEPFVVPRGRGEVQSKLVLNETRIDEAARKPTQL
jgi:hypothetical protein